MSLKKALKIVIPILLGIFFIFYSLYNLDEGQRSDIIESFKNADLKFVFVSFVLGLLSHASRAYRWKYTLNPLGYSIKFKHSFMATMTGYLVNYTIPRAGELNRALMISRFENIPFSKAMGTIVAERIADLLVFIIILMLMIILNFQGFIELIPSGQNIEFKTWLIIIPVAVFLTIFFLRKFAVQFFKKIKKFLGGFIDGLKSILMMKNKSFFIGHTIFIWLMYMLMFWICFYSLEATSHLSFSSILIAFVAASVSIALTNAGIGAYPFAVMSVLIAYGIDKPDGLALGWIIWTTQTILILTCGGISFLVIPFFFKRKVIS